MSSKDPVKQPNFISNANLDLKKQMGTFLLWFDKRTTNAS